jgi:hypothetical protein
MLQTYTIALLTFLCSITSLSAADYHWVGSSGKWSDLNHWATTSGGSIHPQIVPSPFDDIFFDGNSGFVVGDVVTIDVPAFCKDMDWTGALNSPQVISTQPSGQDYLKIYGSLTLIFNMDFQYGQPVEFLSTSSENRIITGGQHFDNQLLFNGMGGSCSLLNPMSMAEFQLIKGGFYGISVKKVKEHHTVRTIIQFEVVTSGKTKKLRIKGGSGEQVEHGGTSVVISQ